MERIEQVSRDAEAHDGAAPLDEATWIALRRHPERVRSWVREDGFALRVGQELSLVVRPSARGRGLGGELLTEALTEPPAQTLLAWSHGNHPAAAALARRHGFTAVRDLWVMRRRLTDPLPEVVAPDGVRIRGYDPARPADAAAVVAVNAAAFAGHPEQGAMDEANLAERMAEPWFDPAGLLLAERDGEVLGFHWTKQHSARLGEVYVVGIRPDAQGGGLGRALTLAGLRHLRGVGAEEVLLYVEADNHPAIAVYSRLGFTHRDADTHVQYRR